MNKSVAESIEILSRTPSAIRALLGGLSEEWTNANEGKDTWSPYDVVGHLIHGEITDWIPRMNIILYEEEKTFVPFDRFAQFKLSQGKSIGQLLDEFEVLRKENIEKLNALELDQEKLDAQGVHPELGPVKLSELLASWTIHDLGHIGQISRVMAKRYKDRVGPWEAYLTVLNK